MKKTVLAERNCEIVKQDYYINGTMQQKYVFRYYQNDIKVCTSDTGTVFKFRLYFFEQAGGD